MKKADEPSQKHVRSWQMSFNDLLTVMLVFFILLVSISNIRADKVQHVSSSASMVFGSKDSARQTCGDDPHPRLPVEGVKANMVEGGVSVVLGESLLYRSGSADIIHKDVLTQLGEVLRAAGGEISVEGHTDARSHCKWFVPSNWELSAQRAVNVVKFLVGECGMAPARLFGSRICRLKTRCNQ